MGPFNNARTRVSSSTATVGSSSGGGLVGVVSWNSALLALLFLGAVYRAFYAPFPSILSDEDHAYEPYNYKLNSFYSFSRIERYTIEHAVQLKYSRNMPPKEQRRERWSPARGCNLWKSSSRTIYEGFIQKFVLEMKYYNHLLDAHEGSPVADIRQHVANATTHGRICRSLQVHPQGLGAVFTSGSLARSPQGLLEPIYPPFGSLTQMCPRLVRMPKGHSLDFLVHDFAAHCQRITTPSSKIILVEVGYKVLNKWQANKKEKVPPPTQSLLRLYRKFGFSVDQIYIFDTSKTPKKAQDWITRIFQLENFWRSNNNNKKQSSSSASLTDFTWKDPANGRSNHPWDWIASNTAEEDFVLVTVHLPPRGVDPTREMELLQELLELPLVAKRMDGLFFHPLVYMGEDEPFLPQAMNVVARQFRRHHERKEGEVDQTEMPRWTIQEAMQLFSRLRQKGIMAHAWVP